MTGTGDIDLPPGRRLYLRELRYLTYEGLLEGPPTAEDNERKVNSLVAEYRDSPYPCDPCLIRAVEKPIQLEDGPISVWRSGDSS